MTRARRLAGWVGPGKPVTANGVLRPAEVAEAGKVIDVAVGRVRSAADVAALHHPWLVAQAVGLLAVEGERAVAGPGSVDDPLEGWLAGLDAVLREESEDRHRRRAGIVCLAVLTALEELADSKEHPLSRPPLETVVRRLLERAERDDVSAMFEPLRHRWMRLDAALDILAEFGAVEGGRRPTPLGRWAGQQLRERAEEPVTPRLPVEVLLTRLAAVEEDESWILTRQWCGDRPAVEAAGELLRAAVAATSTQRVAAVNAVFELGEDASPAWQAALEVPELAAHARFVLAGWRLSPEPDRAQRRWLTVEYALFTLARDGAAAAYHDVCRRGGLEALQPSGHPDDKLLREAVAELVAAGRRPEVFRLKIALNRFSPPVWRRVLVPAGFTLGDLHAVIRVALSWGSDHLHTFTANGSRYSDVFYDLDGCRDEDVARLSRVLPRTGATMTYVYDFGDWWEHTITLEKIVDADPAVTYPLCLTGRGDTPTEDFNPEYPADPTPFDRDGINHRLATLPSAITYK